MKATPVPWRVSGSGRLLGRSLRNKVLGDRRAGNALRVMDVLGGAPSLLGGEVTKVFFEWVKGNYRWDSSLLSWLEIWAEMPSQSHCRNVLSWSLPTPIFSSLRKIREKPVTTSKGYGRFTGLVNTFRPVPPLRLSRGFLPEVGTHWLPVSSPVHQNDTFTGTQWRRVSRGWWPNASQGGLGTC